MTQPDAHLRVHIYMYAYARATQLPEVCMGNACAGRRRMVDAQRAKGHFLVFLDFKLRLSMFSTA